MHRSLTLIPLASLLFAACAGGGGRAIELSVEGAGGKTAYFDRFENNQPYHVDSVTLDGSGKGTLRVKALPLDFYRIVVDQEQLIVALDSAEELSVEAKAGSLATPTSISGSVHSEALHGFYSEIRAYETKRDSIRTLISADPANSGAVNALNALNTGFYDRCKAFTQEHSSSPAALAAVNMLNMQQEMALFKQVRDDMRKTMPRSGYFAQFRDQVDRMEQQEVALKMQEEEMKRLSNLLPVGGDAPGDPAADTGRWHLRTERASRQVRAHRLLGQLVPALPDGEPQREARVRQVCPEGLRDPRGLPGPRPRCLGEGHPG